MTRAIYAAVGLVALGIGAWAASSDYGVERELRALRGLGWLALGLLLLALTATPLGRLAKRPKRAAESRRALGIASAAVAFVHGAASLATYLDGSWDELLGLAWVRAGIASAIVLAALWLTSFPTVTRALRVRLWKPLHRLAFVALAFALWHALLAPLSATAWVLGAAASGTLLVLVRLAAWLRRRLRMRARASAPEVAGSAPGLAPKELATGSLEEE